MFEDGIKFPMEGESAVKRIVIGGLLMLFSFLIIPAFALVGYFVEAARAGVNHDAEPPAFDNWGDLIVKGIIGTVIVIAYAIIPMGLVMLTTGVSVAGLAQGGTAGGILGGVGALGILVAVLAFILVYYAIPAALVNYAIEDTIGAAFDWSAIKPVLFSGDYLVAWIMPFILAFILNVIGVVLAITVVGLILLPFLQFYGYLSVMYMFGRAFDRAAPASSDASTNEGEGVPA